ncbi:hypothetical protein FOMPIDRAFT_1025903 [Fomitopsis schrenkii]|uniref:Uncharacterized protein n=1 Tax=Fomitopsis schrenkii TaxID=2126942 RepID=S8DVB2_FOMSC|nr:hypothetical protein FOMPIDRAFT_1025903 [Fomitopsis schrenkii]
MDHLQDDDGDNDSLWGSPSPVYPLPLPLDNSATSWPVRGNGEQEDHTREPQWMVDNLGFTAEDASLVARYLADPPGEEAVGTCDRHP